VDFERLAAFRAVARERGFSRAARKVFKTQPAVSQAVAALEAELGVRLFDRRGREVSLTPEGRVLLRHVDESFAALERARAELASLTGLLQGQLRLACSDTTACWLLPPVIRSFRERFPGVDLWISNCPSPHALAKLSEREVDLAFVTLPVPGRGYTVEALSKRVDVAIFAPDHALAGRRRVTLRRLLDEPLLLLDRASQTRRFIDERIRECAGDVSPHVAMELASIEVIKRFVELGLGVSIVPQVAVQNELDSGSLAAASVFAKSQARTLGVAYSERGELPPAAAEFLALARVQLR
jgi:DNA-binding transcriptional LysR family regulator